MVAYATQRTMVFKSDVMNYNKHGFNEILQPFSENCTEWSDEPEEPDQDGQIIQIDKNKGYKKRCKLQKK